MIGENQPVQRGERTNSSFEPVTAKLNRKTKYAGCLVIMILTHARVICIVKIIVQFGRCFRLMEHNLCYS